MNRLRGVLLSVFIVVVVGLAVVHRLHVKDILTAYQKGFRVGRVVGRDEILGELKSPSCFKQSVDELMKPNQSDLIEGRDFANWIRQRKEGGQTK